MQTLTRKEPEGEIIRLHEGDIGADPERIIVELKTRSLFGGRRTIWLTSLPAKAHAALLDAVSQPVADTWLIVQAPDLRKSHKITQTFEAAPFLAAIACYGEDRASLPVMIRRQLSDAGYEIDPEALPIIAARSNFSSLIAKIETEKLISFMGNIKRVTIADVDACLGDLQTAEIQETVDAALEGDGRKAVLSFERLIASDQNLTPILMAISTTFQRLHVLRSAFDSGVPLTQAMKDLRPPVFFKQQDALARQTRIWSAEALSLFLRRSNETLKETRLRPQLAEDVARNFLLEIAKTSRQSQKRK